MQFTQDVSKSMGNTFLKMRVKRARILSIGKKNSVARNSLTRFHTTFNLGCYTSDDQITITTHSTSVRSVKMSVHMSVCRDSFLILNGGQWKELF